ncbi:MAG: prepilin-type N-terminal cleavage/methylation domain-containing protein [Bacilli bacterium]|nr:prepilin-type N-terminal cleavage/methylation domain-containing protein [Bacilli bacterium]
MKKNNKGFTLVELLATLVLLGILMGIGLPILTGLLSNNRNKIYVADINRMIALAETKLNSSSSTIEKPDENNCIIMSLTFLDDSSFENPPNQGKYVKDSSYVVIKNTGGGNLEYSATLVEKVKNYYRGIELTRGINLEKSNATRYVKTIDESNLVKIDNVSKSTINLKLGNNYVIDVDAAYDYDDLSGDTSTNGSSSPNIIKATMTSASGKNYNSIDALLTLRVEDKDTPKSDLKVYLSEISFQDALKQSPYTYGSTGAYTRTYNYQRSDEGKVKHVYIIVRDPQNNESRKEIEYRIHKNEVPKIHEESSGFSKLDEDSVNGNNSKFVLSVSDDMDNETQLQVCLTRDVNANNCSGYQPYSSYFTNGGYMVYNFDSNSCRLDGREEKVKVFVKDSFDEVSTAVFSYTVYKNTAPSIGGIIINSNEEKFTATGSLNTTVLVNVDDDLSNNITLTISDGVSTVSQRYNGKPIDFSFSGNYDGKNRTLTIEAVDECGLRNSKTTSYAVYKNANPSINVLQINSGELACNNQTLCTYSDGGKYEATVSLDVSDDIDDDLLVCVSEDSNYCDSNNGSNYVSYLNNYKGGFNYTFAKNCPVDYMCDQNRKLYVSVLDSYGKKSATSVNYKLYKNKSPVINNVSVNSNIIKFIEAEDGSLQDVRVDGRLESTVRINASDDLSNVNDMSYTLSDGVKTETYTFDKVKYDAATDTILIDFTFSGEYDGKDRKLVVTVTDGMGYSVSKTTTYKVLKNEAPVITGNPTVLSVENDYGLNLGKAQFILNATDEFEGLKEKICYKGADGVEKCFNNSGDDGFSDYELVKNIDLNVNDYNGQEYTLYAYVKDLYGLITKSNEVSYKIHKDASPKILSIVANVDVSGFASNQVVLNSKVNDPFDTYKICVKNSGTFQENSGDLVEPNDCTYLGSSDGSDFVGNGKAQNLVYTIDWDYSAYDYSQIPEYDENNPPVETVTGNDEGVTPNKLLFVFVKDSHGNVSSTIITVTSHISCSLEEEDSQTHTYEFDSSISGNKIISAARCSGKCYSKGNDITAKYKDKIKISYVDRLNNSACSFEEKVETIDVGCGYKDCFYNSRNNNYVNYAIGTREYSTAAYTVNVDGASFICNKYYKLYTTDYDSVSGEIVLNPTDNKICKSVLKSTNYYNYNEHADMPYLVVNDD